jgi:hypothetical protein
MRLDLKASVTESLGGERELSRESSASRQLAREVTGAFADFARLAMVTDLDLLVLWSNGPNTDALGEPVDELNTHQLEDVLAALGPGRTLELYDTAVSALTTIEQYLNQLSWEVGPLISSHTRRV